MRKNIVLALLLLSLFCILTAVNIAPFDTKTETFTIGTTATAALPTDWKVDKNTTARLVGTYSAAGTATAIIGGNDMGTSAANGIYNYGAGPAATATDRAIGWMSSSSATKSGNLYVKLTNSGATSITSLDISFTTEKYRMGTNAAGYTIQMYYSTDGTAWTSAGSSFATVFAGGDASNNGYASAPGATMGVSAQNLAQTIASGASFYLAWNFSVTSGSTTSNAQGLGVDDVVIHANGGPTPVINVTGTLSPFLTTVGTPSDPQSYTLSGTNLAGNINLTAPDGYHVSVDGIGGPYATNRTVTSSFNGLIYVILTGASEGDFTGDIIHASSGATNVNLLADGTVEPAAIPTISATGSLTSFSTITGTASAAQTYTLSGSALTDVINLHAPDGFEVSVNGGVDYATDRYVASNYNGLIYVRLTGTSTGVFSGNITHQSTGATQVDMAVSGTSTAPTINITSSMTAFIAYVGAPSTIQSYTLSGTGLTANIDLTAPTGYEISVDGIAGPYSAMRTVASSFNGTVYVVLTGASLGTYNGNITHTSVYATQADLPVTGSVINEPALLMEENFNYVAGTTLVSNGWVRHSGDGTTPPTVTSSGLTYQDYPSISGNAGQTVGTVDDVNKVFITQTSGSIYCSFLMNITSTSTTAEYAFHFATNPATTDLKGRVCVQKDGSNKVRFGLTKAGAATTAAWTGYDYDLATTYLIVLRYDIISGLTNDQVYMWINPAITPFEPTPQLTATDVSGADIAGVGSVAIRQNANTPIAYYDGIRVAKSWNNVLEPQAVQAGVETNIGTVVVNSDILLGYNDELAIDDPAIPEIPQIANIVNPTVIVFSAPNGTANISVDVAAGTWYGIIYYGGAWHSGTPYPVDGPGTILFSNVPFGAKADVPVVISEGDGTLPVELSSFTAVLTAQNFVNLTWTTQSETEMSGYNVYRGQSNVLAEAVLISDLIPATNTSIEQTYVYQDSEVDANATYHYWLEATELNNTSSFHGPVIVTIGDGGEVVPPPVIEMNTCIDKVYPNPFNPTVEIAYNLKEATSVTLTVYNHKGQLIRTLVNADKASGYHKITWNGNDANGVACASGIYFVKMQAGKVTSSSKLVLVK